MPSCFAAQTEGVEEKGWQNVRREFLKKWIFEPRLLKRGEGHSQQRDLHEERQKPTNKQKAKHVKWYSCNCELFRLA